MEFIDQHGNVLFSIDESLEKGEVPELSQDVTCVNLTEGLRRLTTLRTLFYDGSSLEPLSDLQHLTVLAISSLLYHQDLTPLTTCTGLKALRLVGMDKIDVSPVAEMTWLEELMLNGSTKNLRSIGKLTGLRSLWLQFNKSVTLKWFAGMTGLTELNLVGTRFSDPDSLSLFPELLKLDLGNTNIESLAPLATHRKLIHLDIGHCLRLKGLEGIETLSALSTLYMNELRHVPTVRPLRSLRNLKTVLMRDTEVDDHDLSPLLELPQLEEVILGPYYGDHLKEITRRMPRCTFRIVGRHATQMPYEVHGTVEIFQDIEREEVTFRIDQDLTDLLSVETNDDAEEKIRDVIEEKHPELVPALEFDSEGEAFVVRSSSPDALRIVAKLIHDLKKPPRRPRRR